jgi:hypothetical protein
MRPETIVASPNSYAIALPQGGRERTGAAAR